MSKLHIKKGDTVYVNAGEDKGRTGKVLKVFVDKRRAIVEGLNMVSKSQKPSAKNPQGGIVKQEDVEVVGHDNIGVNAALCHFRAQSCEIFDRVHLKTLLTF